MRAIAVLAGGRRFELVERAVIGEYDIPGVDRRVSLGDAVLIAAEETGFMSVVVEFEEEEVTE